MPVETRMKYACKIYSDKQATSQADAGIESESWFSVSNDRTCAVTVNGNSSQTWLVFGKLWMKTNELFTFDGGA